MGDRGRVPQLDGLRGVAILLVLVGHLAQWTSFGAAGVTLFFVLSGYLITGLLRRELVATGRVDLRAFWLRRARRLVPALLPVVGLFAVLLVASGGSGRDFATIVLPPLTFTQDIYSAVSGSQKGPLYHTWSLGVEEQFYLLWPLVVAAGPRGRLVVLAASAAGVSLALRLLAGSHTMAHDAPWSCACLLAAGCLVALTGWRSDRRAVRLSLLGILVLAVAAATADQGVEVWLPPAVAALAAVALAGATTEPLLAGQALRWAGTRSYSLYLWHYPLMLLADDLLGRAAILGLSVVLAETSYRFVERRWLVGHSNLIQSRAAAFGPPPMHR